MDAAERVLDIARDAGLVEASGWLTSPIPTPATQKTGGSAVQSDESVSPCMSSSATPARTSPPPRNHLIGSRSDSGPASAGTTNEIMLSGSKRTPVWSGGRPSTFWR